MGPKSQASEARCGACGVEGSHHRVGRLTRDVVLTRCRNCTVVALEPRPSSDELARYYAEYYLTRAEDRERLDRLVALHAPIARYLLGQVATRPCAVLDYGFGSGTFLRQVARLGHRAFGADVSSQNAAQLQASARAEGLQIQLVDLSTNGFTVGDVDYFDIVTLFQVIEHVPEPLALVKMLARYQHPGGILYLECPNDPAVLSRAKNVLRAWPSRRHMWRSVKYPEHLHGFNRRAIRTMLSEAGYTVMAVGDYAYCDGIHQVESECWWPPLRSNPRWFTPHGVSRSLIPMVDQMMSWALGAGSGLFALAQKR
jgi:2-polyprenyl-3-methyl-5-hydroxy-6-metoxy-1,4-benzoquinol methylase